MASDPSQKQKKNKLYFSQKLVANPDAPERTTKNEI